MKTEVFVILSRACEVTFSFWGKTNKACFLVNRLYGDFHSRSNTPWVQDLWDPFISLDIMTNPLWFCGKGEDELPLCSNGEYLLWPSSFTTSTFQLGFALTSSATNKGRNMDLMAPVLTLITLQCITKPANRGHCYTVGVAVSGDVVRLDLVFPLHQPIKTAGGANLCLGVGKRPWLLELIDYSVARSPYRICLLHQPWKQSLDMVSWGHCTGRQERTWFLSGVLAEAWWYLVSLLVVVLSRPQYEGIDF